MAIFDSALQGHLKSRRVRNSHFDFAVISWERREAQVTQILNVLFCSQKGPCPGTFSQVLKPANITRTVRVMVPEHGAPGNYVSPTVHIREKLFGIANSTKHENWLRRQFIMRFDALLVQSHTTIAGQLRGRGKNRKLWKFLDRSL